MSPATQAEAARSVHNRLPAPRTVNVCVCSTESATLYVCASRSCVAGCAVKRHPLCAVHLISRLKFPGIVVGSSLAGLFLTESQAFETTRQN